MTGPSKATVQFLKRLDPQRRVVWAARLFLISLALGAFCTLALCQSWFERILMAISWGAITITCVDIIQTSDVRAEQQAENTPAT